MDVKLDSTKWHRISGQEMRELHSLRSSMKSDVVSASEEDRSSERHKILLLNNLPRSNGRDSAAEDEDSNQSERR